MNVLMSPSSAHKRLHFQIMLNVVGLVTLPVQSALHLKQLIPEAVNLTLVISELS